MNTLVISKNQEYTKITNTLISYMGTEGVEGAKRCAKKLVASMKSNLSENCVFVAYGGGKDSSYVVAFVRLMQMLIYKEYHSTFKLRIASNRHAGMPPAVLENMDRVYTALGLYNDMNIELLLIDGHEVNPFDVKYSLPKHVTERNRLDILMTGHRCQGDARPTFCNACNLSMVNSFGVAIAYQKGANIVITGDSNREQKSYLLWVRNLSRKFNIEEKNKRKGFAGFLQTMNGIANYYYKDIYGEKEQDIIQERSILADEIALACEPIFFSIYDDTSYDVGSHWELLTNFLGFEFDDMAFSFTESDCGNPALMAHFRGLKTERVYGRTYEEGIREYVKFAIGLMMIKQFPEKLIELCKSRYATSEGIAYMRYKINLYAEETYGISNQMAICMIYSPFTQEGKNLAFYLLNEQPELYDQIDDIHALLKKTNETRAKNLISQELENTLVQISGLSIHQLQILYQAKLATGDSSAESPLSLILKNDPHKKTIKTRRKKNGPLEVEVISGR